MDLNAGAYKKKIKKSFVSRDELIEKRRILGISKS